MTKFYSNIKALYGYQVAGYRFLKRGNGLLAFDVGLGKTATAVAGALQLDNGPDYLIVCPKGLKDQWFDELEQVERLYDRCAEFIRAELQSGLPFLSVTSKGKHRRYVLAHPEQLIKGGKQPSKFLPALQSITWAAVIVDEAHRFSNHQSHQWQGLNSLKTFHKWGLTGTPVRDVLANLYGILKWLAPQEFPSYVAFIETYCDTQPSIFGGGSKPVGVKKHPVKDEQGRTVRWSDEPTLALLRRRTEHLILTKKLADVGQELPEKLPPVDVMLTMPDTQAALYKRVEKETILYFEEQARTTGQNVWDLLSAGKEEEALIIVNAAARFAYLQRVTSNPGHFQETEDAKMDWLRDYVQGGGQPAVIFTRFVNTAEAIKETLAKLGASGQGFIVGTYDSLSEGHNFQHLHVQIRWDLPLRRQHDEQATGRLYRTGQKEKVQTFRLFCKGTLDLHLRDMLQKKQDNVTAIVTWLRGLKDA